MNIFSSIWAMKYVDRVFVFVELFTPETIFCEDHTKNAYTYDANKKMPAT